MKWIHRNFVVLWDVEEKRGWLTNGTSALLHLLRASLEDESKDEFNSVFCFRRADMREPSNSHQNKSAIEVLLNHENMELEIYPQEKLRDRVEHFYDILEKVMDHWASAAGPGGADLNARSRKHFEGWDFKELATDQPQIFPRVAALKETGWVNFTRAINAVTLFGSGFGEIIQPARPNLCTLWAKLPKGRNYLAACVSDLRDIMEMHGNEYANPMELIDSIAWHSPENVFGGCQCIASSGTGHSDLAQMLIPLRLSSTLPKREPIQLVDCGAVVFGYSNCGSFWDSTGGCDEGDAPVVYGESETEFNDSGVGRSIDSATSAGRELSLQGSESFVSAHYRIGIVCALQKELMAVRALFDDRHRDLDLPPEDTNHYAFGRIGNHNVVAACLPPGDYGTNSATDVASNMRRSFPELLCYLLIGIGGGVPSSQSDIRLGDVVVGLPSETHAGVIQYDRGRFQENSVFKRTGSLQRPPRFLMTAISSLTSDPDLTSAPLQGYIETIVACRPEYAPPNPNYDKLFTAEYLHNEAYTTCEQCDGPFIERPARSSNQPQIHYGLIASGNQVMKNAQVRDHLGALYSILCFEMEAAGVLNTVPCLVIRGICDYADSHKNNIWQEYASATAAAYAKLLLAVIRGSNDSDSIIADPEMLRASFSRKRTASSSQPLGPRSSKRLR
jgi:nucleoside phosphorylase